MRREADYIRSLRGGMHIVQLVDIHNDPLTQHNFEGEWLFLEWLANGTVGDFVWNARHQRVQRLSNRLLWRFFLCLVRGCCGIAWPRNRQDGLLEVELPVQGVPPSNLKHNDLHRGNVLLGEFSPHGEHGITPILKLIDFGFASDVDRVDPDLTGVQSNLWYIGELMAVLITLDPFVDIAKPGRGAFTTIDVVGERIQTNASPILPAWLGAPNPYPWLDEWLATIVALCLASDRNQRPTLQTLTAWISYAIVERNAMFYGVPQENDNTIKALCEQIILNAPTQAVQDAVLISS